MTVAYGTLSGISPASGFATTTRSLPSGVAAGDLLVMVAVFKLGPTSQPSVSGWTSEGFVSHGSTAATADAGSMRGVVWSRVADGSDTSPTITWGTIPDAGFVYIYRLTKDSGASWSTAFTSAVRSATDTAWSVTYDADPGLASGDFVGVFNAVPTDVSVGTLADASPAGSLSATGLTAGSATERINHGTTTTNTDASHWFDSFQPTAGTSSAAATYSTTLAAFGVANRYYGVSLLFRAREVFPSDSTSGQIDLDVTLGGSLHLVTGDIAGQTDLPVALSGSLRNVQHLSALTDLDVVLDGSLSVASADSVEGQTDLDVELSGSLNYVAPSDSMTGQIDLDLALSGSLNVVTPDYLDTTGTASLSFIAFATSEIDVEPTVDPDAPVIYQVNASLPEPDLNGFGRPDLATFVQTDTTTDFGGFQIIVGGRDMTTVRGHRTLIESYSSAEPFGDATCVLRFPGISPFEDVGEGAAADIVGVGGNPNVTIWRVRSDGTVDRTSQPLFQGFGASEDDSIDESGTSGLVMQCAGAIWQASFSQHQPHFGLDSRDIGQVIAAELNGVKGRRFATCVPFTINIPTRKRGSWGPRTDYVQELLSEAVTPAGDQWTVLLDRGRKPKIGLKDTTTAHWTMSVGTKGLTIALQRDRTQAENVIFGTGVAPNQSRWANTRYPNLRYDDPPAFPYANLALTLSNGTVDADTDSGTGVTDWQTAAFELGYDVVVDGTFGGTDESACEEIQRRAGLPITGEVDADTWTFTFNVGADVGDLTGAYFAPIAQVSAREPFLYDAAGSVIGANPDYDPRVMRVERHVDYGEGVTRAEAAQSARLQLSRANGVDFSGTLTLSIDPEAGSRWHIRAGQNINLKWYRGRPTTLLHIARVECSPESGTVTLTVDTQARDLPTLAAVRQRNKDATDPARALRGKRTSSRTQPDLRPIWDAESGAGRIPSFPKSASSWSVVRVPAGQAGTIATLTMSTTGSPSRFATAIFGRPITAADMDRLVGEPLEPDGDGGSKWDSNVTALEAEGLLAAFGGPDQAAGYYPGTDPDSGSEGSHTLTGRLVDNGGFLFDSLYPPWLWVAVWTELSCYVTGRMFLSVLDQ